MMAAQASFLPRIGSLLASAFPILVIAALWRRRWGLLRDLAAGIVLSAGAVMAINFDTWVIAGNRFISNTGRGVGALYLVDDCGGTPIFDQASMRANTWRSNRVTGGEPQIYRDVRTEGEPVC